MNIVQITPGAGGMYCGNCFRDNALVAALRKLGHSTLMVPLYLPMTLEEEDQSAGTPIFFSGVNVYLEQKSALFRHAPDWLHHLLESPKLLKWAAGKTAKTRPEDVGNITISMLRGEGGHQARELEELIAWLKQQPGFDVVCLSNALLVGMVRKLKQELRSPVVCMLQGEDYFLDSLAETHRDVAWKTLAERAAETDLFIAPSNYFAELMSQRLSLPADRVRVVYNGVNLNGFDAPEIANRKSPTAHPPVLGYFARMCREKGLDRLVEAFILLKRRDGCRDLKLHIGGGCGPSDEPFVESLRVRLKALGVMHDVEFHPNLTRKQKIEFLRGLTVFSVPALYGEAFGLYVIEALASGVPVVQPRTAAFPELVQTTGGGVLYEPGEPKELADAVEQLLARPEQRRAFGEAGRKVVLEKFTSECMARNIAQVFQEVCSTAKEPVRA
jgi:glycosyltransferase involved in cell wall biosynthesis